MRKWQARNTLTARLPTLLKGSYPMRVWDTMVQASNHDLFAHKIGGQNRLVSCGRSILNPHESSLRVLQQQRTYYDLQSL